MSIANSYTPIKVSGDGSTVDFSFNFTIYAKSDIKVSLINKTTGAVTTRTLGTHYDVAINLVTEGGIVTFDASFIPAATEWVYLESNIDTTQPTEFGVDSKLSEKSVERMGDRQCRLLQQTNLQLSRSLKLPIGSTIPDFLIDEITAGGYLRINQTADGVEMGDPVVTELSYDGSVSAGLDANKPASPTAKDIYIALDTGLIYICASAGVWTPTGSSGAYFTGLASIPSGAGVIPIANLASGTPTGSKFIRDDGSLQVPFTPSAANALAGSVVQYQRGVIATVVTCATAIPNDDTIPQITEGNEVVTVSITPTNANNLLIIKAGASFFTGSAQPAFGAIFQDAIADALSARVASYISTNESGLVAVSHKMVAGGTSPITFRFRVGGATNTLYVNGNNSGNRILGGVQVAEIEVWEVKV